MQNEVRMEKRAATIQSILRVGLKAFKPFPLVTNWLSLSLGPIVSRKRFLVLTGPSGVGKTEYARSLFAVGSLLELNCAGVVDVCLSSFDAEQHRAIFWDELSAKVVVKNRKVFQHPSCFVELGHSPTAQHVQHYWLNDCVSIIATNRWYEDLHQVKSQQDQRWLGENSIVLSVDSPMFLAV
jgi:hypothetical protein